MVIRNVQQIGAALQQARRRQGLTQAQLAAKAGLRHQTISAIEGGKPRAQFRIVFDIMTALNLELTVQARNNNAFPDIEDLF